MNDLAQRPTRVAAVTGASRGLGAVFARVLSQEGFAVALGARDVSAIERLPPGARVEEIVLRSASQTPEY